jgi:hypothetical protein
MAVASSLTAKVGIPSLQKSQAVLDHERPQAVQLVRSKTVRLGNADWVEPKLCDVIAVLNMDVRWLRSFKAVKEKTKARNPQHRRHRSP